MMRVTSGRTGAGPVALLEIVNEGLSRRVHTLTHRDDPRRHCLTLDIFVEIYAPQLSEGMDGEGVVDHLAVP